MISEFPNKQSAHLPGVVELLSFFDKHILILNKTVLVEENDLNYSNVKEGITVMIIPFLL